MDIGIIILIAAILILHNRAKSAMMQSRKEEMTRELIRVARQKQKLNELYGRGENE